MDVLEGKDTTGKILIWVRVGFWEPSTITADELLQVRIHVYRLKNY